MGGKEYREGEEWNDLSSCDRCTCMVSRQALTLFQQIRFRLSLSEAKFSDHF